MGDCKTKRTRRGLGGGGGEGYEKLKRVIVIKELIVLVCR